VAKSGDEFLQQIDAVVRGRKATGDRKALLAHATWDDRTRELLTILDEVPGGAPKPKESVCAAS